MKTGGYLLLSFGDNAWGRTYLARVIGEDLRRQGRVVRVLSGKAGEGSFEGSGLEVEILPDLPAALLKLYLEDSLERLAPMSVVFCDGDCILQSLRQWGVDLGFFGRMGTRVFGIDTWSYSESGAEADVFGDGKQAMQPWPAWLNPVKLAPLCRTGSEVCSGLFPVPELKPGAAPSGRFAMLSTAPWQHVGLKDGRAAELQREVPVIMAEAIGAVAELDLVHVGPAPLPGFQSLGVRYRWTPALPPSDYLRLMGQSAVYLSLSPVCTAQTKALCLGIPVIIVQHIDAGVIQKGLPYPFRIWPVGYSRFLEPVLRGNPLLEAVTIVELSRLASLEQALRALAFEGPARRSTLARQEKYVKVVKGLRQPASYIIEYSEGIACPEGGLSTI